MPPLTSEEIQGRQLFNNWVEYKTDSGTPYYYNSITNQTTWVHPSSPSSPSSLSPSPSSPSSLSPSPSSPVVKRQKSSHDRVNEKLTTIFSVFECSVINITDNNVNFNVRLNGGSVNFSMTKSSILSDFHRNFTQPFINILSDMLDANITHHGKITYENGTNIHLLDTNSNTKKLESFIRVSAIVNSQISQFQNIVINELLNITDYNIIITGEKTCKLDLTMKYENLELEINLDDFNSHLVDETLVEKFAEKFKVNIQKPYDKEIFLKSFAIIKTKINKITSTKEGKRNKFICYEIFYSGTYNHGNFGGIDINMYLNDNQNDREQIVHCLTEYTTNPKKKFKLSDITNEQNLISLLKKPNINNFLNPLPTLSQTDFLSRIARTPPSPPPPELSKTTKPRERSGGIKKSRKQKKRKTYEKSKKMKKRKTYRKSKKIKKSRKMKKRKTYRKSRKSKY